MEQTAPDPVGALRVHRGAAAPEELAALIAVLHLRAAALGAATAPTTRPRPPATWNRPERQARYTDPRGWSAG
ncbi:acyl-CoA carboxylase epsilon subunit [Streptomyces sp. NPDC049879]|uniref:acyl-CoA carboxylase epsilon subunit n=1 Tax=Streptomyces sp. NPDC049879 TaxID=3365598 RepID=UPI0037B1C45B